MSEINERRLEVNDFAKTILSYLHDNPEILKKIKPIYRNIINEISSCIKEDEYKLNHPLKIRYALRMNEVNYEALCDMLCDLVKYAGAKLPEKIHKRIMLGKTNNSVREYAKLA